MANKEVCVEFNGDALRNYLKVEMRKRGWLAQQANISLTYLDNILKGAIPSQTVIQKLSRATCIKESVLIRPKRGCSGHLAHSVKK